MVTFLFRSALSRQRRTIHSSRSVSVSYARTYSWQWWAWFDNVQKWKASSCTGRLESIVLCCCRLLESSRAVLYWHPSISGEFCDRGSTGIEVRYWRSIDLEVPINSVRLQMQSLGWSDASFGFLRFSKCLFRASYDRNSWLHFPSLAHRRPPSRPVSIFCVWNGRFTSIWMGQNGTETSPFFGGYCTPYSSGVVCSYLCPNLVNNI